MTTNACGVEELPGVAKNLIQFAGSERFFVFEGEMGAGKTTFIKAFCQELGIRDLVSSPTFSIVNEYDADGIPVYHFDFYRLKDIHEAYDIGYEEYFYSNGICLIEWPEKIPGLLPASYIKITIEITGAETRQFTFQKID